MRTLRFTEMRKSDTRWGPYVYFRYREDIGLTLFNLVSDRPGDRSISQCLSLEDGGFDDVVDESGSRWTVRRQGGDLIFTPPSLAMSGVRFKVRRSELGVCDQRLLGG